MTMTTTTQHSTFSKFNPATGDLLGAYPICSSQEVNEAVATATETQKTWAATSFEQRKSVLVNVSAAIKENAEHLATLISQETGKPIREAYESDLAGAVNILDFVASNGKKALAPRWLGLDKSTMMGRLHWELYEPRGVCAVISPWNFPLAIATSGIAAALMAGNTVLLKPSELTPETGIATAGLFQSALQSAGLNPDIIQCLTGDGSTGEALSKADIDYIIFTGSSAVGQKLSRIAAEKNIGISTELGGNDALILLDSVNKNRIDSITSAVLWSRFMNAGQACGASKRLIVHHSHYDATLSSLLEKVAQLKVGPPTDPTCHMGPVISKQQCDDIELLVNDALDKGATCLTGGKRFNGSPYQSNCYFEPTILTNIPESAAIFQHEAFGPVLAVYSVASNQEAITLANATPFGLTANVFGSGKDTSEVAQQLDVGLVAQNDIAAVNYAWPHLSWQGHKASGSGNGNGSHGLRSMQEASKLKTITQNMTASLPLFLQLAKSPWFFSKHPSAKLSKALLKNFAGNNTLGLLSPELNLGILNNLANTKL